MNIKEVELYNFQIRDYAEYINEIYKKDGLGNKFSLLTHKNIELIPNVYNEIMETIYDENKDASYQEYVKATQEIALRHVDRDEQGNPKFDKDGRPVITEMIVEFQNDMNDLNKKYESLLQIINERHRQNFEYLRQRRVINLYVLPIEDIPNEVPPYIVGIIAE